ncbi:MAG TPA: hypothetical protein VMC82_05240 [Thermoplasmata archaeon]|nr:hypothetical protein [Thermoplasmata archaeon]
MTVTRAQHIRIERTFDAPAEFAFRWCTDYTPGDSAIEKDEYSRRILSRTPRRVVFQDFGEAGDGHGWFLNQYAVTLRPPYRWHAESVGTFRSWSLDYAVRPRPDGTCRFTLDGVRRATPLAGRAPSVKEVEANIHRMWGRFGRALARDYRASIRPGVRRRRPRA